MIKIKKIINHFKLRKYLFRISNLILSYYFSVFGFSFLYETITKMRIITIKNVVQTSSQIGFITKGPAVSGPTIVPTPKIPR